MSYQEGFEYEPQEHDEIGIKIMELIKEEVKAKMTETVDSLEMFRKVNQSLDASLRKERQEHEALKRKYDKELRDAVHEKGKEVMRGLFGGFERGDKIFFTLYKYQSELCFRCKGEKKLTAILNGSEEQVRCPSCDGSGSIHGGYYIPKDDMIRTVSLEINEHAKHHKFWLQRQDGQVGIESVFKTIEECQISCDEKNKPKEVKP